MTTIVTAGDTGLADQHNDRSYVDWPAIIAGVALASAISVLLLAFGSAIGLSMASPYRGEGTSGAFLAIAAGLWLIWVQVSGFFAGAYLTGRLRRRFHDSTKDEKEVRDGSHGLLVWAVGLLLGAWIAASGLGSIASTATNAAATVASGAASGAADAATDAVTGGNDLLIDRLLRPTAPAAGAAPADATPAASPPAGDTATMRDEIGRILSSGLTAGKLDDADRGYLVSTIQQRTGVDEATAGQRVDQFFTGAQQAAATAKQAADTARRYSVLVAFMTAASLLVSALAAYFAAGLGGRHRDEGTYFTGGWEMFR